MTRVSPIEGIDMGQHKHNPNCQLAKEGKLPPKEKPMDKREFECMLYTQLLQKNDTKIREATVAAALERHMTSAP